MRHSLPVDSFVGEMPILIPRLSGANEKKLEVLIDHLSLELMKLFSTSGNT